MLKYHIIPYVSLSFGFKSFEPCEHVPLSAYVYTHSLTLFCFFC